MKTAHDLVQAAKLQIHEVSITDAEQAILNADFLLDVRESEEFLTGHIPGALHISRGMLEFKMASDPMFESRDNKIVLYCKTSGRAALCAKALQDMGYKNILSISGGIDAWLSHGKAIVNPANASFD